MIGDILQSIGVAIAGALIWYNQDDPRWYIADPICTFIFSIVVLLTTKSILRDIVHVLMERTPTNINIPAMSQVCTTGPLRVCVGVILVFRAAWIPQADPAAACHSCQVLG